jgi:hypothetical protein
MREQSGLEPPIGGIAESGLTEVHPLAVEEAAKATNDFRARPGPGQKNSFTLEAALNQFFVELGEANRIKRAAPPAIAPRRLMQAH